MSNNTKIFVVDFEDSFTFNIASEIYQNEKRVEVISHGEFFRSYADDLISKGKSHKFGVVLGPGPGHPEAYSTYFEKISILKNSSQIFLMGICLGHQIISLVDGLKVRQSSKPMHGAQVKIDFNNTNLLVQRYNSLSVYSSNSDDEELMVRRWNRGISYQFHPESIGTHHNHIFFSDMFEFLSSI